MSMRTFLWLAVALSGTGCIATASARTRFHHQTQIEALTRVRVDTSSGDVVVQGGGALDVRGQVEVRALTDERARGYVQAVEQRPPVEIAGDQARIGDLKPYGLGPNEWIAIDYEVRAPQGAEVVVDTASGDVRVEGVRGPVDIDVASGDVSVENVRAGVKVDASSGNVRIERVGGEVRVDASSGSVRLVEVGGSVRVDTSSGNAELFGAPVNGARWEVSTASGDVTITLPTDAALEIVAETSSGEIRTEMPLTVVGRLSDDRLEARLGENPTGRLTVSTSSGNIELRHGPPKHASAK